MVTGFEHMKKFSTAARTLMEAGFVDSAAGRYSKTLFMSVTQRASDIEACALAAALEQGWSLISLEFGKASKSRGPANFSFSFADGKGGADITHDCALATDADDRYVLVPRGPVAATFHFAVGPDGLERRHGRPADIAASAIRASRALVAAARNAPSSDFIEVHTFDALAARLKAGPLRVARSCLQIRANCKQACKSLQDFLQTLQITLKSKTILYV